MAYSFEDKKNIRRQLMQDLGRTPTNEEYFQALASDPMKNTDLNLMDPEKMVTDEAGNQMTEPTAIDKQLADEKLAGASLYNKNEKLLGIDNLPTSLFPKSADAPLLPGVDLTQPDTQNDDQSKSPASVDAPEVDKSKVVLKSTGGNGGLKDSSSTAQTPVDLSDKEFEQAQSQANQNKGNALLMAALGKLGTSVANLGSNDGGIKNNFQDTTDALTKNANDPVTQLEAKRDQYQKMIENKKSREMNDPNSAISQQYREFAQKMGMPYKSNATAADLDKLSPLYEKLKSREDSIEARKLQYAMLAEQKRQSNLEKMKGKDAEMYRKILDATDPGKARNSTAVGREMLRFNAGQHVLNAVEGIKNLNDVNSAQKTELVYGVATMISQGVPTKDMIDHLNQVPVSELAAMAASRVTGKPYGANAAGLVQALQTQVRNQMKTSSNYLAQHTDSYLKAAKRSMSPEAYSELENDVGQYDYYNYHKSNTANSTGIKTVTLTDGSQIKVKPEDLAKIDKADIKKVE